MGKFSLLKREEHSLMQDTNLHSATLQNLSDAELVAVFVKNQSNAHFGELYRRYAHLVYGVSLKYMKDQELAKDMVTLIFEKLYRKIPSTNVQNFKSYVYGASRNECIARLRKLKSERDKKEKYTISEKSSYDFMETADWERQLDGEVAIEDKIEAAILKLPEDQRRCVRLFFYENKSYKEIVAMTDFDLKQVKSYLQNGKRNLRNILKPMMTFN